MILKINVLGTKYEISEKNRIQDKYLSKCDGYCDKTSKKIVVIKQDDECEIENFDSYLKQIKRHEIIHAFLYESGLGADWTHPEFGHDETYVDWFASQFPKIHRAFTEAGCLD